MANASDRVICLHHADCMDGAAAAAVVALKYPSVECVAMRHGDPIPVDVSGALVFVVDFSFKVEVFREIIAKAREVRWYDHHKTALEIQKELGFGDLEMSESGASLTWKKCFPDKPVPPILAYVRDKDLWLWELPGSRAISESLSEIEETLKPKDPIWANLLQKSEADLMALKDEGERLLKKKRREIEKACERGFPISFHGHRALAVNWTGGASSIGEYIYKDLGYEVAALFYFDGKYWKASLRSNRVDVSALAQIYGGGGHPGAAGFRTNDLSWVFPK